MPAHSEQGALAIDEQAFHAIQSVGSIQSKTASHIALIGTAGSSSDDESSRLSSQLSSDSLSRHDDPINYSIEQRAMIIREVRATRMKQRASDEVLQLDCSLDELPSQLRSDFDQLAKREKTHAVTIYNIVINSLTGFYERNGGEGTVESRISDFLTSQFIINSTKTRSIFEDESKGMEEAMLEVTSMLLLQLYTVQNEKEKEKVDKNELVKKLRCIYLHNCASAQRAVLEEDITDLFSATMPIFVCELFEELGLDHHIPIDLEEQVEAARRDKSLSVSSTVSPATHSPPQVPSPTAVPEKSASPRDGPKPSLTSRLEAMLDEFLDHDDVASERSTMSGQSQGGRMKTASQLSKGLKPSLSSGLDALLGELNEDDDPSSEGPSSQSGRGEKNQGVKRKAPPTTPSREERRPRARRVFVPETPDEKNGEEKEEGRKTRSQMKDDAKAVVKQTPMEKLKSRKSTRGDKLAEMVKTAADSPALTGGVTSALRSRVRDEGDRRSSLRNGTALFKDMKPTTRWEFLSANRDKGEKKSRVRMNLATKLGTPMGGDEKEERRIKKKRKTEGHISSLVLDSDAISKYKKRMKETVAEGKEGDDSEVFYGRMSNRVGLFDDRHEKEEAKVVYNRAGRVVYSPSCVFVAHTLLNVYNKTPLLPTRPSTSSAQFKVNRLVRPASKGNRLKLKKLKERLSLASPKKEMKKEQQ
ncbi:hypothetical protein PRIPAC_83395 [Pristionchus pacificus]|uniref:Treslin N-terminal domain-containing protein n=1 Tax=Pristionchus pacificus TaxID=54126 RepID=A0A8R1U7C4_PRIPA|nr:hypothetical protein PRIPAC_83395 [Pristionchus pacificus]